MREPNVLSFGSGVAWMVVCATLMSLSGFWNAVIFFRPQFMILLRELEFSRWEVIKIVVTIYITETLIGFYATRKAYNCR